MKSFSLKSRWIDARDEHYPSPQDKLKFDDKVEFPSGYSPPNFYNQLLIYSLEIFKQVSKFFFLSFFIFFFFFEKKILAPFSFSFLPFYFFFHPRDEQSLPANQPIVPSKLNLYRAIYTRSMFIPQSSKFSIAFFADQHRGRATPARFGYSLNSIVYLLIAVTDISIWCAKHEGKGGERRKSRDIRWSSPLFLLPWTRCEMRGKKYSKYLTSARKI